MTNQLPHTMRTQAVLAAGERQQAIDRHNQRVTSQLERAQQGETINLSDLMAAKDELLVDHITQRQLVAESLLAGKGRDNAAGRSHGQGQR